MQQTFIRSLLSLLGLARKEELQAAEDRVVELAQALEEKEYDLSALRLVFKESKSELSTSQLDHRRLLARQKWCLPALVDFPPGTPRELHEKTRRYRVAFLKPGESFSEVFRLESFLSTEQWALYWCLVYASKAAARVAPAKTEDGISREFLTELAKQAQGVSTFVAGTTKLQIAYCSIFDQSNPAMKEAAVGADILLVVAGQHLVPDGLARLFWVQAKKARAAADPFTLHYDEKNSKCLQVDALTAAHRPDRGAVGCYIQYSERLPYVPAVSVRALPRKDGKLEASLSELGVCLPEFIVSRAGLAADALGAFASTDEILDYLDEVSDGAPLYLVTVVAEGELELGIGLRADQVLSTIAEHYRQRLEMEPNLGQDPEPPSSQHDTGFEL